jgi:proteic killer suppression protein
MRRDPSIQAQRTAPLVRDRECPGVQSDHQKRRRMQLTALDTAQTIDDMDIPGFRLRPLKGDRKGQWAVTVNRNWRLVFKFADGNASAVDYEDYH